MLKPRSKILYVLAVGVFAFVLNQPPVLLALLALQLALWFIAGLDLRSLVQALRRLLLFVTFIVLSYAFFGPEGGPVLTFEILGFGLDVSEAGVVLGLLHSSRIVTVVVCAQLVQRTGNPSDFVQGLRALRFPEFLAHGLDLLLASLGGQAPGEGHGRRARGRGKGKSKTHRKGFRFKRILKGDVSVVAEAIEAQMARTRDQVVTRGLAPSRAQDLVVIVGLAVFAMTIRLIQIMPGLPVAPGHKGVILIPLYIVAHTLTNTRWGATQFGLLTGIASFLMGQGRFGPFDILRHVTPGLFVDLVMPLVMAMTARPGAWMYGLVGLGAAVTRISTLVVLALLVDVPPAFYALLLPAAITGSLFGALSGVVTFHLMKLAPRLRGAGEPHETDSPPDAQGPAPGAGTTDVRDAPP